MQKPAQSLYHCCRQYCPKRSMQIGGLLGRNITHATQRYSGRPTYLHTPLTKPAASATIIIAESRPPHLANMISKCCPLSSSPTSGMTPPASPRAPYLRRPRSRAGTWLVRIPPVYPWSAGRPWNPRSCHPTAPVCVVWEEKGHAEITPAGRGGGALRMHPQRDRTGLRSRATAQYIQLG